MFSHVFIKKQEKTSLLRDSQKVRGMRKFLLQQMKISFLVT